MIREGVYKNLLGEVVVLRGKAKQQDIKIEKLQRQMMVALCNHDPVPDVFTIGICAICHHMKCSKCGAHLRDLTYEEYVTAKLDLSLGDSAKWQKALDEIEKKKDGAS